MASPSVQKGPADESNGFLSHSVAGHPDLLFAWLTPYSAEQRSVTRPQHPPTSPLMKAKHALKRTFTPSKQMNKQQEKGKLICKTALIKVPAWQNALSRPVYSFRLKCRCVAIWTVCACVCVQSGTTAVIGVICEVSFSVQRKMQQTPVCGWGQLVSLSMCRCMKVCDPSSTHTHTHTHALPQAATWSTLYAFCLPLRRLCSLYICMLRGA